MTSKLKNILASLLAIELAFLILPCSGPNVAYADSETQGVMVNVVYDDSGSMVRDNNDTSKMIERWSQAKYAMEVFCAMLGPSDVMNIYPMSQNGACGLTLSGTDIDRVTAVHGMDGVGDTPFVAVTSAASDLMGADDSYEKWLVVITDGEFNDTENSAVQNALNGYNEAGINTVFLGIGDAAPTLSGNEGKGGYAEKASDGSAVLEKVTGIANQIFSHQVLSDSHVTTSSGGATLSLDIPVSQLVIFAQGNDASIGNVTLNGSKLEPSLLQNVRYSDVKPSGYENAIADESLIGVLAVFDADESPFGKGSYTVEVTGSAGVEYYYTPGVTVNCDLIQNGAIVNKDDKLYAGDYEISLNYVDPLSGEAIESDLLPMDGMSLTLENNQETQVVEGTAGHASLAEGAVSLHAMAELPGHVFLTSEKAYKVLPDPIELSLELTSVPRYSTEDLQNGNADYTVLTVRNGETGKDLTEEEWQSTEISVTNSGAINWDVSFGDDVGTWKLTPSAESISEVVALNPGEAGTMFFDVEATYQVDDQYAHGVSKQSVPVGATLLDWLKEYGPKIIVGILVFLFILGHIMKKRLNFRGYEPRNYMKGKPKGSPIRMPKKDLLSVILPFVPERALVKCKNAGYQCACPNLKIVATGHGAFRIVNYKSINLKTTKICNHLYKSQDELKKEEFTIDGFKIATISDRKKELGSFKF